MIYRSKEQTLVIFLLTYLTLPNLTLPYAVFRVQGSGFGDQGSGIRDQGFGYFEAFLPFTKGYYFFNTSYLRTLGFIFQR